MSATALVLLLVASGSPLTLAQDGGPGPDCQTTDFGHEACLTSYAWVDPADPGDAQTIPLGGNELSDDIDLPFAFPFFGTNYDALRVSSNGFLTFQGETAHAGCCSGHYLRQSDDLNNVIAGFWTRLQPNGTDVSAYPATVDGTPAFVVAFDAPYADGPRNGTDGNVTTTDTTSAMERARFQIVLRQDGDFSVAIDHAHTEWWTTHQSGFEDCTGWQHVAFIEEAGAVDDLAWYVHQPSTPGAAPDCLSWQPPRYFHWSCDLSWLRDGTPQADTWLLERHAAGDLAALYRSCSTIPDVEGDGSAAFATTSHERHIPVLALESGSSAYFGTTNGTVRSVGVSGILAPASAPHRIAFLSDGQEVAALEFDHEVRFLQGGQSTLLIDNQTETDPGSIRFDTHIWSYGDNSTGGGTQLYVALDDWQRSRWWEGAALPELDAIEVTASPDAGLGLESVRGDGDGHVRCWFDDPELPEGCPTSTTGTVAPGIHTEPVEALSLHLDGGTDASGGARVALTLPEGLIRLDPRVTLQVLQAGTEPLRLTAADGPDAPGAGILLHADGTATLSDGTALNASVDLTRPFHASMGLHAPNGTYRAQLYGQAADGNHSWSGAQGTLEDASPGLLLLEVPAGWVVDLYEARLWGYATGTFERPVVPCAGTLAGSLAHTDGTPVESGWIQAWTEQPKMDEAAVTWGHAQIHDGRFTLTGLSDGLYTLQMSSHDAAVPSLHAREAFTVSGADLAGCGADATPATVHADAFTDGTYDGASGHAFTLPPSITLRGTVRDTNGTPVADADVYAHPRHVEGTEPPRSYAHARTDADGAFVLRGLIPIEDEDPATGFNVDVRAPHDSNLRDAYITHPDAPVQGTADTGSPGNPAADGLVDNRLDLVLEPGARVHGRILGDPLLEGVPDTFVNFHAEDWNLRSHAYSMSGEDGAYEVRGLALGNHHVRLDPREGSGYASKQVLVDVATLDETIDFELERTFRVEGCIQDESGTPVEGAWVHAWNRDGVGDWDASGTGGCFSLDLVRHGSYRLMVEAPHDQPDLVRRSFDELVIDPQSEKFADDILTVSNLHTGVRIHDVDANVLVMVAGGTIEGCVVDGDPAAPSLAYSVDAWSGTQRIGGWAAPDADGCFAVRGLPEADDYHLTVRPHRETGLVPFGARDLSVTPGQSTWVGDGEATGEQAGDPDLIFLAAGHTLVGDVVDPDGTPVPGAHVSAWREDGGAHAWGSTDSAGHFELVGLPHPGDADDGQGWFLWIGNAGDLIPRSYPLQDRGDGLPWPDQHTADNEDVTQNDDPNGDSLAERGITDGRRVITLSTDDDRTYIDTNADVTDPTPGDFEYGDGENEEPIVLLRGTSLDGLLLDGDGSPVSGAWVSLSGPSGWSSARTTTDGTWTAHGLADGDYNVWVNTRDDRRHFERYDRDEDDDGVRDLSLGCQVGGADGDDAATDPDGEPADGCVVELPLGAEIFLQVDDGDVCAGARVEAWGPGSVAAQLRPDGSGDEDARLNVDTEDRTPGDGLSELRLSGLTPGVWTVRISHTDCFLVVEQDVQVASQDQTVVPPITLEPIGANAGDLTGTVTRPDGSPATSVLVLASYHVQGEERVLTYSTATDATGRYALTGIPAGTYTLRAIVNDDLKAVSDGHTVLVGDNVWNAALEATA